MISIIKGDTSSLDNPSFKDTPASQNFPERPTCYLKRSGLASRTPYDRTGVYFLSTTGFFSRSIRAVPKTTVQFRYP